MFDYGTGLLDGMWIQAAADDEKEIEKIIEHERAKAFRLAIKLLQEGDSDTIDRCLASPDIMDFYCKLYNIK